MISLFEVWLVIPVRSSILNLSKFGRYYEKKIQVHMVQSEFNEHNREN
ncbi:hypothetical protein SAMN05661012_06686 [Chitinophaga sancti]|uniref:Uncharacterized protein n=1 Tax=Chitinophaga sancti TaxID=1004 RepID=A0A1K1T2M6_9BACT|nr:hypothetical protein SAMN05661012_06686 [Chitinophaga sancti]